MTFHVGQKVVCVNDREVVGLVGASLLTEKPLSVGNIYTVIGIMRQPAYLANVKEASHMLFLAECTHPNPIIGFVTTRFRPVQEKGMSILRSIAANPKRELERV